jgi:8-oxo-dGTP pyrophosphatase MutT (NUDIX family)
MRTIPVVAAVIRRNGRYLVGRRPEAKRHGGLWEFPGGKLHPEEDPGAAVRRELREELDLVCGRVGDPIWSARDPGSPFVIDFLRVEADGEPVAHEHQEVGWFTMDELREMELAPTDAAFVAFLVDHGRPDPAA